MTNGLATIAGVSLLGAMAHFGLPAIDAAERAEMRDPALRGGAYTTAERKVLIDYCMSDVPGQEVAAVGKMPDLMEAAPAAVRATGTDVARPEALDNRQARSARRSAQAAERGVSLADVCSEPEQESGEEGSPNLAPIADLGESSQDIAAECESRAGWIRTSNQQIMSLLL
jgi:hypothetical protein